MKKVKEGSNKQVILGIILSILILAISQGIAITLAQLVVKIGIPEALGNVLAGILYPLVTYLGVFYLCKKILKVSLETLRITKDKVTPIWVILGVAMPFIVIGLSAAVGGHWSRNTLDGTRIWSIVTGAILFFGFATGIVEEMIFRGVIMGCLERRFNRTVAILVPSILFGALHVIGNKLSFISIIQLLIAGSLVGILFSLITYETGSIWNSAIVHGIWNMVMIGGILQIGSQADSNAIFNFVFNSKSFLISGGDFGIEASVLSILVYALFSIFAFLRLRGKIRKK